MPAFHRILKLPAFQPTTRRISQLPAFETSHRRITKTHRIHPPLIYRIQKIPQRKPGIHPRISTSPHFEKARILLGK
jgi:hypothetical protein